MLVSAVFLLGLTSVHKAPPPLSEPLPLDLAAGDPDAGRQPREGLAYRVALPHGDSSTYPFEPLIPRDGDTAPGRAGTSGTPVPTAHRSWREVHVEPGDSMSIIFSRLGLSANDLHAIVSQGEVTAGLKRLRPGQRIRIRSEGSSVEELVHEETLLRALHIQRNKAGAFVATMEISEPDTRIATGTGVIQSSLFVAGQQAGLSDPMILRVAEIFGWDIDFVLDIRSGDRFSVVYEEYLKEGRKIDDGPILATEFVNQGKVYRAVRYIDADGRTEYYSEDGKSMRKAFLRTPVNFTRISSNFNLRRRHPVLNTIRAHRGVDYAAPHGTPVKATGDGKVISAGRSGGYGNVIVLQHGGSYKTLYAHLSRFARGLRPGQSVRQGQTIAYVGSTGLATGPHLHYEFRINDVHKDPLKVQLPKSLPIPDKYRADFLAKAEPLLATLNRLSATSQLANRSGHSLAALGE